MLLRLTVDNTTGLVLTVDGLSGQDAATLEQWMGPIADADGSLSAVKVTREQALADLERLGELVIERKPKDVEERQPVSSAHIGWTSKYKMWAGMLLAPSTKVRAVTSGRSG